MKSVFVRLVEVEPVVDSGEVRSYRILYPDGQTEIVPKEVYDFYFFPLEDGEKIRRSDIENFVSMFSSVPLQGKNLLSVHLRNQETIYKISPTTEETGIYADVRERLESILSWGKNGLKPFPVEPLDNENYGTEQ